MSETRKKRDSKFLPWLGFLLILAAGLFVLFQVSASRSLDEAIGRLEAAGRPVTLEELVPKKIPDEDNAAPVYAEVIETLKTDATDGEDPLKRLADAAQKATEMGAGEDALAEFRALYEAGAVAEALAIIEEASRKGYWRELDYSKGFHLSMAHLTDLMKLSRVLAATARLQAADGDHAAAIGTAFTALRLARALENEPLLISQLVRVAMFRQAAEALRGLDISEGAISIPPETGELLRSFEDPAPFVAAMDMERIMGWQASSQLRWADLRYSSDFLGDVGLGSRVMLGAYKVFPPLLYRDQAAHARFMGSVTQNLQEPFSPGDQQTLEREFVANVPPGAVLTRMITPALGSIKKRLVTMTAESRVMQSGLAVLEHRQRTGTYPEHLPTMGEASALDPFTGEPLVYRPGPGGFTLHSVGGDLGTDGGSMGDPSPLSDVMWRYVEGE